MSRLVLSIALTAFVASSAVAQVPGAAAKAAAHKAAAATDAHIAAEQRVEDPPVTVRLQGAPAAKANAPAATAKTPATIAKTTVADARTTHPAADTVPPDAIQRELFEYPLDGRRDPFVSLLTTSELRPAMSDLRLTGILVDNSGGNHSVATLRDISTGSNNKQYRVTVGSVLGRMRVSAIRFKTIVFTIDAFGTTRDDSLVLGDSTKVRDK
jgi:hypothetical protein